LQFQPGWTSQGYTVIGWGVLKQAKDIQDLLNRYYTAGLNQQEFSTAASAQSKLNNILENCSKLAPLRNACDSQIRDKYRQQADLLMAHLHEWEPGMKSMSLDFDTGNHHD